jgi:Ca-activated chloride channel family protein
MVNGLVADGGTEMIGALKFALSQGNDPADLKQGVFITDGSIGNESALFKFINTQLGNVRLFTVGIGSAPNSYFMNKVAKFGRGSSTFIADLQQVNEKMARLFDKISRPVMRDITMDWAQQVEQYPARIPDLYAGEPITMLVKSKKPIKTAKAGGTLLATPWQQTLSFSGKQSKSSNLDTVWARAKIASLMDELSTGQSTRDEIKPKIIVLGLAHQIVSKFTSLVAVETQVSKPDHLKAKHNNVPNLMPKGSAMPMPQTATPADLLMIIGSLMLLLSAAVKRLTGRKHRQRLDIKNSKRGLEV